MVIMSEVRYATFSKVVAAFLMLLILLGVSACAPVATPSTKDQEAYPVLPSGAPATLPADPATSTQAAKDVLGQMDATEQSQDSEQLLVAPTLAPTATPGLVYNAVQQVVETTNLEENRFLGLFVADWINLAISLLFVVLTLTLIARLIVIVLEKSPGGRQHRMTRFILILITPYLRWFLGVIIIYFATARLQFLSPEFKQWLAQIYFVFIVGLIVIALWKLVDTFSLWYQEKVQGQDERSGKEAVLLLSERALRAMVVVIGLIVILDHLGFNISALLTAIGIGGLAISLAAQDTIANMISGVIILIDQPFRVGDRIEIQELNTWGDVVSIGLRSTRIRTLDNRMVIVPNSSISNNQVVNYTFPDPRYRIQTEIGVAYGTDLRLVRELITRSLQGIEGVIPDKPVDILFWEFGDSAMLLRVRWWIESYIDAATQFRPGERSDVQCACRCWGGDAESDYDGRAQEERSLAADWLIQSGFNKYPL